MLVLLNLPAPAAVVSVYGVSATCARNFFGTIRLHTPSPYLKPLLA